MKQCKSCGWVNKDVDTLCASCNSDIQNEYEHVCNRCGFIFKKSSKFCPKCGANITFQQNTNSILKSVQRNQKSITQNAVPSIDFGKVKEVLLLAFTSKRMSRSLYAIVMPIIILIFYFGVFKFVNTNYFCKGYPFVAIAYFITQGMISYVIYKRCCDTKFNPFVLPCLYAIASTVLGVIIIKDGWVVVNDIAGFKSGPKAMGLDVNYLKMVNKLAPLFDRLQKYTHFVEASFLIPFLAMLIKGEDCDNQYGVPSKSLSKIIDELKNCTNDKRITEHNDINSSANDIGACITNNSNKNSSTSKVSNNNNHNIDFENRKMMLEKVATLSKNKISGAKEKIDEFLSQENKDKLTAVGADSLVKMKTVREDTVNKTQRAISLINSEVNSIFANLKLKDFGIIALTGILGICIGFGCNYSTKESPKVSRYNVTEMLNNLEHGLAIEGVKKCFVSAPNVAIRSLPSMINGDTLVYVSQGDTVEYLGNVPSHDTRSDVVVAAFNIEILQLLHRSILVPKGTRMIFEKKSGPYYYCSFDINGKHYRKSFTREQIVFPYVGQWKKVKYNGYEGFIQSNAASEPRFM